MLDEWDNFAGFGRASTVNGLDAVVGSGTSWTDFATNSTRSILGAYTNLKVAQIEAGGSASVQGANGVPEGQRVSKGGGVSGINPLWLIAGAGLVLFLVLRK